jgi:hypothetical protein
MTGPDQRTRVLLALKQSGKAAGIPVVDPRGRCFEVNERADDLAVAVAFASAGSESHEWINGHLLAVERELAAREGQWP